jgi:glycosyltransferase involved in cell wall biosynthesis
MLNISVVVTTYNRPDALEFVLKALAAQSQQPTDVIIADDGSSDSTLKLINKLHPQLPYPLQHFWQEDSGFRAALARNKAAEISTGDYLIFIDGDCIPQTDFIKKHSQIAEKNCFVAGNRILLSQQFTSQLKSPIWAWSALQWILPYLRRDINRFLPLIRLPIQLLRKRYKKKWQGAKTCNLAVWRNDFFKINGFDENFKGWGHEDADLVVRLLCNGVSRKNGRFAVPVFHLWHPEADRSNEKENRQRLDDIINKHLLNESKNEL